MNRLKKLVKQDTSNNKKLDARNKNLLPEPESDTTALSDIRSQITSEIEQVVSHSDAPVALAFLADKAQRTVGYEKTIGSNWAGFGSFLNFLQNNLPDTMRITTNQPYYVVDERRHKAVKPKIQETPKINYPDPHAGQTHTQSHAQNHSNEVYRQQEEVQAHLPVEEGYAIPPRQQEANQILENNQSIRDTISRVHEYTHVPALAPSEYQVLFEVITDELSEVGLKGRQTCFNISSRAKIDSVELTPEDAQFVLDIISEADPWFEKGISPPLFAERFLNAIIARCRANGLHLTQEEFELVSAWFTGNTKNLEFRQNTMPEQLTHNNQETWLLPNSEHEAYMEPTQQLRQPYIDPLNHQESQRDHYSHPDHMEKELPRMFRLGSDG